VLPAFHKASAALGVSAFAVVAGAEHPAVNRVKDSIILNISTNERIFFFIFGASNDFMFPKDILRRAV